MNGDGQFVLVCMLYCTCTCQFFTIAGGWGRWVIIWFWQQLLAKRRPVLPFTTACTAGSRRVFRYAMINWLCIYVSSCTQKIRQSWFLIPSVFLVFHLGPLGRQAVAFISLPDGQSGTWCTATTSYPVRICSALLSLPMSTKAWNKCGSDDLKIKSTGSGCSQWLRHLIVS